MCTTSMIGDHYRDKWTQPEYDRLQPIFWPNSLPPAAPIVPAISREEFDALKRDVEEMKSLLKRAKAYDEANGEPDCEMDEKIALLRRVAKLVGVDIEDVLGAGQS